jgi:TonB family protein
MRAASLLLIASLAAFPGNVGALQTDARQELNQGVQAYRARQYETAIDHFKRAVDLDPQLIAARLYLATAYASRYMPGVGSEENQQVGQAAIDEFKRVVNQDSGNTAALAGIANMCFNMKKMDEAKEWYKKLAQFDAENAEAHYSIGAIDWTQSYQPRMALKAKLGLAPDSPFTGQAARDGLCRENSPKIEEGMAELNRAIELRPDYGDAMAYLNLMYREKADCESDAGRRSEDLKQADEWIQRTLEIKKQKATGEAASEGPPQKGAGAAPAIPPPEPGVKRIRTGTPPRLLSQVNPVYPPLALQARIQGTVRLEALIGTDGTVKALRVISGHPLLVHATLEAVKQWRYEPTLLNGEPVEVTTTIDVPFFLPYAPSERDVTEVAPLPKK